MSSRSKSQSSSPGLSPIAEDYSRSKSFPSIRAVYKDIQRASKYHGDADFTRAAPSSAAQKKRGTAARQTATHVAYRRYIPDAVQSSQSSIIGRIASRVGSIVSKPRNVTVQHPHPIASENLNVMRTMKYPELTTRKQTTPVGATGGKKKKKQTKSKTRTGSKSKSS